MNKTRVDLVPLHAAAPVTCETVDALVVAGA